MKAAEGEYARSLSNLKSAASELQSLGSRVHSSSKAANGEGRAEWHVCGLQCKCPAASVQIPSMRPAGLLCTAVGRNALLTLPDPSIPHPILSPPPSAGA